jgi:hypothetical protein
MGARPHGGKAASSLAPLVVQLVLLHYWRVDRPRIPGKVRRAAKHAPPVNTSL